MPSRKVRRRREKLQRHEYEYVLENDEGEEIVVESPRMEVGSDGKPAKAKAAEVPRDRAGREIPKPSMGRVMKRTAIFAPLILIVVYLTSGEDASTVAKIYTTVMLLLFFIPFSYVVDVFMYRMMSKRQQRAKTSKG
jgi:hypothetical protein